MEPTTSKWGQKRSPLQIIELLTEKTWGRDCVIFGEQKNKEQNGETPLRTGQFFEWIIKQLLNSAFVGYEEFCRSRRVLSTSAFGFGGLCPSWSAEFFISYSTWFKNCFHHIFQYCSIILSEIIRDSVYLYISYTPWTKNLNLWAESSY